jgi:hypothetical protein
VEGSHKAKVVRGADINDAGVGDGDLDSIDWGLPASRAST